MSMLVNWKSPQLIETVFKENLIKKLIQINRNIDRILSDTRINHLVKQFQANREIETLSKQFANKTSTDSISMSDIETSVERSMPLCMQMLHKALTSNGHLKHTGRMQYGLFLKGIGLSLEESLEFWKGKFKNMAGDKFDKEHAYNIRHNYGKRREIELTIRHIPAIRFKIYHHQAILNFMVALSRTTLKKSSELY